MAKKVKKSDFIASGQVAVNRRATFDYAIEETFTAGLELRGTEVKSLRLGKASLTDTYGSFADGELFIENLKIEEYANKGYEKQEPNRKKKLLYFNERGLAKLEVGIGKGKKLYDKRESIKERELNRKLREW